MLLHAAGRSVYLSSVCQPRCVCDQTVQDRPIKVYSIEVEYGLGMVVSWYISIGTFSSTSIDLTPKRAGGGANSRGIN